MDFRDLREKVRQGDLEIGPATTTGFFPILLPWRCCDQAAERCCAFCGEVGYTHGTHSAADLHCLACDEHLTQRAKLKLLQAGAVGEGHVVAYESPGRTYQLVPDHRAMGGMAIKCLRCGLTSYHPEDVRRRYCGNCKQFHREGD